MQAVNPLLDAQMVALAKALVDRSREIAKTQIPLSEQGDGILEANTLGCAVAAVMQENGDTTQPAVDVVSTAFALSLSSFLESNWCCTGHALRHLSMIASRTMEYALNGVAKGEAYPEAPPAGETCH